MSKIKFKPHKATILYAALIDIGLDTRTAQLLRRYWEKASSRRFTFKNTLVAYYDLPVQNESGMRTASYEMQFWNTSYWGVAVPKLRILRLGSTVQNRVAKHLGQKLLPGAKKHALVCSQVYSFEELMGYLGDLCSKESKSIEYSALCSYLLKASSAKTVHMELGVYRKFARVWDVA